MKRDESGFWYVNACDVRIDHGRAVKISTWIPAGTFERACIMMLGGHI
jgi:hypothetical protein